MRTRFLSGVAVSALAAAVWWLLDAPPTQTEAGINEPAHAAEVGTPPAIGAGTATERERGVAPDPGCTELTVRVVDEHGQPVAGMVVDAFLEDHPFDRRNCVWTDAQGTARLSLPPGVHCVTADRGWPKLRPDLWSPTAMVQLPRAEGPLCLVMERYCCTAEVRVVDDIGTPLEGVCICQRDYAGGPAPREQYTDAAGTAVFQGVPPGTLWFALELHSSVHGVSRPRSAEASCSLARDGFTSIEYRLPRLATVVFVLREDARVVVALRYVGGPCEDPGPINGWAWAGMDPIQVPPGTYESERFYVHPDSQAICRGPLKWEALPGQAHEIELPVERISTRLSIRLQDERGMPVEEAHVRVLPGQGGSWVKQRDNSMDAGGRYEMLGIPQESLIVEVDTTSCHDRNLVYLGGTDARPWLDLTGPVADLLVVLHDAWAIQGTVLDAEGQPLPHAVVTRGAAAGCGAGRVFARRDEHGQPSDSARFAFRCLRPGKYPLWIGEASGRPPDAEVEVGPRATPSRTAEVVLRQRPAPAPK